MPTDPRRPTDRAADGFRRALEAGEIGLWRWDLAAGTIALSPRACDLMECSATQPLDYRGFIGLIHLGDHPEVEAALRDAIETNRSFDFVLRTAAANRHLRLRGKAFDEPAEATGIIIDSAPLMVSRLASIVTSSGFIRDLTDRQETRQRLRDLQAELIHMSRFSAMGEMASTLAHELNQPLTAVASYLNGCRRLLDGSESVSNLMLRDAIDRAADQALRAGQIIRRLRQFVARGESDRQVEDLTKMIEEAGALALVGIKETGIQVTFRFDPRVTYVLADKIQVQQVLLNLVRNAIEAMHETHRRQLTITTEQQPNGMVEVRVADTGPGVAPDVGSQLFQPFVSTKPNGMGVGLSISRTIVEAHGGRLLAESNPGGGTIFRLTLKAPSKQEMMDGH